MRNARILAVENDSDILTENKKYLEAQGYEVETAKRLSEARAKLHSVLPDLVLLDVVFPDGSGYDFCREIRAMTSVPVIFLTCVDETESIVKGLSLGGDDYIVKPHNLDVLSARVAAQLRRSGLFSSGRVELPPLTVDLMTGQAVLSGEEIHLSQKELQLLCFFAANIGKRLPLGMIYEQVWGAPSLNDTQTVTVHVSRLRQKLRITEEDSPFTIRLTKNKEYTFNKAVC